MIPENRHIFCIFYFRKLINLFTRTCHCNTSRSSSPQCKHLHYVCLKSVLINTHVNSGQIHTSLLPVVLLHVSTLSSHLKTVECILCHTASFNSACSVVTGCHNTAHLTLWRYVFCLKSKCTDFLFECLLDSPEITSCLLQSMNLGKLHNGSNVFSTDHSGTGSHFL